MPEPRFSIAQRRVGLELRRLRAAAGKTLDDVATIMEWSPSKVSRVETGESRILARDVHFLCRALGAEADVADALVELVKAAKVKGWWEPYRDVLGGNYIPFEAAADEVNEFQMEVVPGLLQTSAYARAVVRGSAQHRTDEEVERRVQARLDRRDALDREDQPLKLWAIISEGALRREIGGREVLRAQLKHMVERLDKPNIELQVLPFEAGAHPALSTNFIILRFEAGEPLVFGNGFAATPEVEDPSQKSRALDTWVRLQAMAESPDRSRRMLKEAAMGR
ncbi:MAG: helix-turn-helix domain-containing protein [Pseudonocardia sp.]|nr:helix-turn-helix domain-containing protein [Pseudonocardia sp.]